MNTKHFLVLFFNLATLVWTTNGLGDIAGLTGGLTAGLGGLTSGLTGGLGGLTGGLTGAAGGVTGAIPLLTATGAGSLAGPLAVLGVIKLGAAALLAAGHLHHSHDGGYGGHDSGYGYGGGYSDVSYGHDDYGHDDYGYGYSDDYGHGGGHGYGGGYGHDHGHGLHDKLYHIKDKLHHIKDKIYYAKHHIKDVIHHKIHKHGHGHGGYGYGHSHGGGYGGGYGGGHGHGIHEHLHDVKHHIKHLLKSKFHHGHGYGHGHGGYGHSHGYHKRSAEDVYTVSGPEQVFDLIETMDVYGCGKQLVCELEAKHPSQMAADEALMLQLFSNGKSKKIQDFDYAAQLGFATKDQVLCRSQYKSCPYTADEMMSALRNSNI